LLQPTAQMLPFINARMLQKMAMAHSTGALLTAE
jgi:hypothetical protein